MRKAFFSTLADLADEDERIVLLTGDLGFMFIEEFADRHPRRFVNVGVAEQNMVGIATGLAEGGFLPFTYSIATFASLRPFEFIRNGPVMHRLPVRIVGIGGGFEYGTAGSTHHGLEDLAIMRSQPGLTVIAPADHQQASAAVRATAVLDGPVYFRLGKDDQRCIPGLAEGFELGRVDRIGRGKDVAIVATGAIAYEAVAASSALALMGVAAATFIVPTVSPSPAAELARVLSPYALIVSVEAHYRTGGLGSLVAEVMADHGMGARLARIGVDRLSAGEVGTEEYLNEVHGLSASRICERVFAELQERRRVA